MSKDKKDNKKDKKSLARWFWEFTSGKNTKLPPSKFADLIIDCYKAKKLYNQRMIVIGNMEIKIKRGLEIQYELENCTDLVKEKQLLRELSSLY